MGSTVKKNDIYVTNFVEQNGGGSADKFNVVNVPDLYALDTDDESTHIDDYLQQAGITMDEFLAFFNTNTIAIKDELSIEFKTHSYISGNQMTASFGAIGTNMGERVEIFYDALTRVVTAQHFEL